MNRKISIVLLVITVALSGATPACSQSQRAVPEPLPLSVPDVPPSTAVSTGLPQPTGFLSDFANVIEPSSTEKFEHVLKRLQDTAQIDFAIALVRSTNGRKIDEYSLQLSKEWQVGSRNGGILLLVAVDDRTWQIQIDRRLERDLTDDEVKQIGGKMAPYFKEKDYDYGLRKCVEAMIFALAQKQKFEPMSF